MDRKQEIASAVSEIRIIEKEQGVTRESLGKIKERLIRLARPELFPASDFPPPAPGGKLKSCLGITGEELNRFYDRSPEGPPRPKGETVVKQGTGVCFLPDDLHSIQ